MKPRTGEEVKEEIEKLKEMKDKVRQFSIFRDNNRAAIEAQITVLYGRFDVDKVEQLYESGSFLEDNALEAVYWMNGDEEEAPSSSWQGLVEE